MNGLKQLFESLCDADEDGAFGKCPENSNTCFVCFFMEALQERVLHE